MRVAHRAKIAHCHASSLSPSGAQLECFDDGLLILEDGYVANLGPAPQLLKTLSEDVKVIDHKDLLLVPGFIDTHIHFPQTDIIASYGDQLLEWLEDYTYPAEMAFADRQHAQATAAFFVDELLRNGTTSALVFATVHPHSVDALFTAAQRYNMRVAAGKVLMDRFCPPQLRDSADTGYRDSQRLIEQWHKQDRLHYAITPRFAVTSSEQQLAKTGALAAKYPDTLIQTHLAENPAEVRWVQKLFPDAASYLDVYRQHDLVRENAVFAHCIHLDDQDFTHLSHAGGGVAFCPTSNLFLGSGLFNLKRAENHGVNVGLGTDIGGGTSFSLLRTLNEAYKVEQLQQRSLSSTAALYLITLGAAKTLGINDKVGNFDRGKEADFVVLDNQATPLLSRRIKRAKNMADELFVHMTLGDDRSIAATYIMGQRVYSKSPQEQSH